MIAKKTSVISVRVTDEVKNKLELESEMKSVTLNTLTNQVLSKHVEWDRFAEDVGFVSVTRAFLRALLQEIDEKTIKAIAVSVCKSAWRDAAIYMHGELTLDSLIKTLDLWLSASHIPFRHIMKNGLDRYVVQHELGEKWSKYFVTVSGSLLNDIGYTTTNLLSNDQSVSFEIKKLDSYN